MRYKTSLSAIAIAAAGFAGAAHAQGLNLGAGLNSALATSLDLSRAGVSLDVASDVSSALDSSVGAAHAQGLNLGAGLNSALATSLDLSRAGVSLDVASDVSSALDSSVGSAIGISTGTGVATAIGLDLPSVTSVLTRLRGNGDLQAAVTTTTDLVTNASIGAASESGASAGLGIRGTLESVLNATSASASAVSGETAVAADAVGNVRGQSALRSLRGNLGIGAALEAVTNASAASGAAMSNRIATGLVSASELGFSPMAISNQLEAAAVMESGIETMGNAVSAESAASAAATQGLSVAPGMK
jgi:hypothetical protein